MPTRASSLQNSTLTGLTREVGSKYDEIKIVADNMSAVQELAGALQSGVDLGEIVNVVGDVAALELAMDGKVDKVVGSSLMTDVERAKLAGVAAGATVNKTDAYLLDRVNHTGVQSLDTTIDATDRLAMTAAERLKLSTVESRANHTGTQSADTLTDGVANVAMTVGERSRLAAMEDGANNYVHPASHPVSILDGGTNYNKVVKTDALGHVGFGDVSWTDVAGKPSTYTPSAHEHSLDEVTSGTISATRVVPTETRQFVSASQLANIADMELKTNRGIPNGYAPLNANGKINASYINDLNLMEVFTPNDLNSMLNLTSAQPGDVAYRLDTGNSYMLIALPSSLETNWKQLNAGTGVVSINGLDGIVALGSANVPESGTNYYFTNERVDDRVVGLLQAGNNISLNYDDAANTLTVSANDISVDWGEIQNKPDPVVTVTLQGDVTGTANATMTDMGNATVTVTTTVANDSHTHTFSNLTSKPTTVSGYGITDAYTKTEADSALSLKAPLVSPALTGTPTTPTAVVGTNTTQIASTAYVKAEISNATYSKTQLNAGQLDNRYYTETELNSGVLDTRYYTEAEIDTKLAAQNDASEIVVVPTGNLASTNVQAALVELQADINNRYTKSETDTLLAGKVDDSEIASVNLLRADKYLAAQNIANMTYVSGDLAKIQYNTATDVDYETLGYTSGNLTSINHYVGSVLKGTTTLSYTAGNLTSAVFVGV